MWFSEDMQASFESSFPRYLASCLLSIDETDLSKLLKKIGWMPFIKPFFAKDQSWNQASEVVVISVIRVGNDTFGDLIFQKGLQN